MPIIQRPYVPPDDEIPKDENFVTPGSVNSDEISDEPITFYADSLHIYSSLYSAVLFFGEQMEEREPILRSRIKVSPQMHLQTLIQYRSLRLEDEIHMPYSLY